LHFNGNKVKYSHHFCNSISEKNIKRSKNKDETNSKVFVVTFIEKGK
jgi:hypothetical protein